ncbi:MAG: hypothetical protein LBG48_03380, partial [Rickettsiales bacterium]|nr:hypothetical protein [Rickettsiales bacterium]
MNVLDILRNTIVNIAKLDIKRFFKRKTPKCPDYKLLIRQNNFYNRLKSLGVDVPVDLMNSGVFNFAGGLTDQFVYLAGMIDKKIDYKCYFINTCADHGDENLVFRHFNVKKYLNYEFIKLPSPVIKLYAKCGLINVAEPPFLFRQRGDINSMIRKYPDILQLQT